MSPGRKSDHDLPGDFVEEFAADDDGDLSELPVGTIVLDPDCLLDSWEEE